METLWSRIRNSSVVLTAELLLKLLGAAFFAILGTVILFRMGLQSQGSQLWLYVLASLGALSIAERLMKSLSGVASNSPPPADGPADTIGQASAFQQLRQSWKKSRVNRP